MNAKYLIVGGFHASGSSAVTDLLKEYQGFLRLIQKLDLLLIHMVSFN